MAYNVTVAKVVGSDFDTSRQLFRRKVVGADGFGYQFVRPISIDIANQSVEAAIAHDLRQWLHDEAPAKSSVVPFAAKYNPMRPVTWLPDIHIARPTRHYWYPDRQQIHSRIKTDSDETYNLFTPIQLVRELLRGWESHEVDTRAGVYGDQQDLSALNEPWQPN